MFDKAHVIQIDTKKFLVREMINGFTFKLKNVKEEIHKTEVRIARLAKKITELNRYRLRRGNSVYIESQLKKIMHEHQQSFETLYRQTRERDALGASICRLRECYHERSTMKVSDILNKYLAQSAGELPIKHRWYG